jgi:hypothetical protein
MIQFNPAFLVNFNLNQTNDEYSSKIALLLVKILEQGIDFEFLNPKLLGGKWETVVPFDSNPRTKNNYNQIIDLIGKVIYKFDKSYSWQEKYETGDINKILDKYTSNQLIEIAFKLNKSNTIITRQLEQKNILQKGKLLILKEFKAFYTKLQLEQKVSQLQSNFFVLKPESKAIFGLLSVSKFQQFQLESILKEVEVSWQVYSWIEPIVSWKDKNTDLNQLISKSYTPEYKTLSGLLIFQILWSLLVGFALSDIIGGIVLILLSFILRSLPNKKNQWLVCSKNLSYSGFCGIVFGLLVGRIAGRDLSFFNFLSFLKNFQLLDLNNSNSILPLNQILSRYTPHISWLEFNFGLILFFATIITFAGIFIKTYNHFKLGYEFFILCIIWIVFLISIICSVFFQQWLIVLAPVILLYIFQPEPKLKNFFCSRNSISSAFDLIFKFSSWFILLLLGIILFWLQNSLYSKVDMYFLLPVQFLVYTFFGLGIYQLVYKLLLLSFVSIWKNPKCRKINSENNFHYWKF